MRDGWDLPTYEETHGCYFLGGIIGGLFGGGSTSVATTTNTTVEVEVNPQIGIDIDLSGVEETLAVIGANNAALVSSIAESDREQSEVVARGLEAQAQGLGAFAKSIAEGFKDFSGQLLLLAAAGAGVYFVTRRK